MLSSHKKTVFEILGRHPIHPFPARMAPGIALEALGECNDTLRVLDPMAGSGTVLAVAKSKGHRAFGVDLDPLAVLLASVWTRTVEPEVVNQQAAKVLDRAKREFDSLSLARAYPVGSDEETRSFIRFWFDDYVRRQLAALSVAIKRTQDSAVRNVLWCGFSRLIITKHAGASRARDLSHSRPHREWEYAPVKPFNKFTSAVKAVTSNCPQASKVRVGPACHVNIGDARRLNHECGSIDLVLSSPPYLNAIDYMRCSKFSLVWMGYTVSELRQIRGESVGAEASLEEALSSDWVQSLIRQLAPKPRLSNRHHAILARYVWDMSSVLSEVSRVLRKGGRAVYVVGDSMIRSTFIRNSEIVRAVGEEQGLRLSARYSRGLPANRRYLPPPKRGGSNATLDARMRREVVLVFDKVEW